MKSSASHGALFSSTNEVPEVIGKIPFWASGHQMVTFRVER